MAIQGQLFSDNLGFDASRNPQNLSMENNICGFNQFSFTPQEKPLQYQQSVQYHHPHIQSLQHHGGFKMAQDYQTMPFSHDLASLVQNQSLEIDQFVALQNERLKLALQEQRKQTLLLISKKCESKINNLLRQKDEEIAKAVNKTMRLEHFLKRIEIENETWQTIAKEKEELVCYFNNTIEKLRENACLSANRIEDAESCCDVAVKNRGNRATELIEVKLEENLEKISKKVICKSCNMRRSCIVLLPCRHLCLCESCEAFLHSCPVCGTEKKATIQAMI